MSDTTAMPAMTDLRIRPTWIDRPVRGMTSARTKQRRSDVEQLSTLADAIETVIASSDRWRDLDTLTPRQLNVAIAVIGIGSQKEAAEQLFVTVQTVKGHLTAIYRKLGIRGARTRCRGQNELAAMVVRYVIEKRAESERRAA